MFPLTLRCLHNELSTYQRLRCAVQSMSVVSAELWVGTLQGRVSRGLWLLDTGIALQSVFEDRIDRRWRLVPVTVSLLALIMLGTVLGLW